MGANAKQRRSARQPEFLPPPSSPPPPPPPPPPSSEKQPNGCSSIYSNSQHLHRQAPPLDLGREQPRQQLETKNKLSPPRAQRPAGRGAAGARLLRAARPSPPGRSLRAPLRPKRSDVCVCVRARVCVPCVLRHPAPAPAAYGGSAGPAPGPRVPGRSRHGHWRTPSAETVGAHRTAPPRRAGRFRGDCGSVPPAHAPERPRRRKVRPPRAPPVLTRLGGRQRRRRESPATRPALEGRLGSQHPRFPVPRTSSGGGGRPPGRGPRDRGALGLGRRTECAHLGAAHPGCSGPHARVRACCGSQRGWGRPEGGLRAMPSGRRRGESAALWIGPPPPPLPPPPV